MPGITQINEPECESRKQNYFQEILFRIKTFMNLSVGILYISIPMMNWLLSKSTSDEMDVHRHLLKIHYMYHITVMKVLPHLIPHLIHLIQPNTSKADFPDTTESKFPISWMSECLRTLIENLIVKETKPQLLHFWLHQCPTLRFSSNSLRFPNKLANSLWSGNSLWHNTLYMWLLSAQIYVYHCHCKRCQMEQQ